MHIKANLDKHRPSYVLSWAWAGIGFTVFALIAHWHFTPTFALQFAENMAAVKPLFWGSCVCYFGVAWVLISDRRLPYSNNFEVLITTSLAMTCLLLLFLAAIREFYSLTYLLVFFCFQIVWFGLEIHYRNRFVQYRFLLFPATIELHKDDFPEFDVWIIDTPDQCRGDRVDAVVVDFNRELETEWRAALADCQNGGVPIVPLNAFLENAWGRIPLELVNPATVVDSPAFRPYLVVKVIAEWCVAFIGLLAASPLMVATALLVRITSPGPVLFRQKRVGLGGKPFVIFKFKTMHDLPSDSDPAVPRENGDRLTRIGGFLRKYHLDELPQLLNVVKGEMALIGPRPETVELTELYSQAILGYGLRNALRPGVTSWALIHQGNVSGVADTKIKLSYDLFYLKHVSPFLDLYILLKTIVFVVFGIETLTSPTHLKAFGNKAR